MIIRETNDRLFLSHNTDLGPPYRVLVDTNFINFSIQNKIELVQGMMDCLMAKCASADHVKKDSRANYKVFQQLQIVYLRNWRNWDLNTD
jgi:predicted sulfurtransferase